MACQSPSSFPETSPHGIFLAIRITGQWCQSLRNSDNPQATAMADPFAASHRDEKSLPSPMGTEKYISIRTAVVG